MERITSRANPLCAHIRKLNTDRRYRRERGEFVCDGPKLLEEAVRWGAEITALICAGDAQAAGISGIRTVEVPEDLLKSLSTTEAPQGVLCLCRTPDTALPDKLGPGRYLILDGVQDPGNLGTVWRSADAFGADGLILINRCADPWGPKAVRASMGACFRLPVWEADPAALWDKLTAAGVPLYATALRADTEDVRAVDLAQCAVVIGSEGRGVSEETLARCAKTLKIPMRERCESLNAAVAAAVVLWEMWR